MGIYTWTQFLKSWRMGYVNFDDFPKLETHTGQWSWAVSFGSQKNWKNFVKVNEIKSRHSKFSFVFYDIFSKGFSQIQLNLSTV